MIDDAADDCVEVMSMEREGPADVSGANADSASVAPAPPQPDLVEWMQVYSQEGDGCSPEGQDITIRRQDDGGGPYFVIETPRWAFNDLDELVALLRKAGCW